MNFSLSSEECALRDSVRRYCAREYSFSLRRERLRATEADKRDYWRTFAELGALEATLPSLVRDVGNPVANLVLIMQELGRSLVVEPMVSTLLCGYVIQQAATSAQREHLLPLIRQGELLVGLAHNEPNTNWRCEGVRTNAELSPLTGEYILSGRKTQVLDASMAEAFLVSARVTPKSPPAGGLSVFLIPRGTAGLFEQSYDLMDGFTASDLRLERVRVPAEALLGAQGSADAALEMAVDCGMLALSAEAVGAMEEMLFSTRDHLKSRRQYGVTLIELQALQHRLADMLVEIELSRSMIYRAAGAFGQANPALRRKEVCACKAHVSQSAKFVGANGLQLHGAMGFSDDYKIGHFFKRLTTIAQLFGSIDHQLQEYMAVRA